jgi:hypothetical protein
MSTIKATTLSTQSNATVSIDTVVNGTAKAWVNFNGTGTVAIRASFNVSSITDNGTGNYTVNFTTAMPDANYSAIGSTQGSGIAGLPVISANQDNTQSATATKIYTTTTTASSPTDLPYIAVAIFR